MTVREQLSIDEVFDTQLPAFDVSDGVATVVAADVRATWDSLMSIDLIALGRDRPLVGVLSGVRALPQLVRDAVSPTRRVQKPPSRMTLRETASEPGAEGSWVLLDEQDTGIALGLVGKFWRPVIAFASPTTGEEFRDFAEPGYAKTVYALSARELDQGRTLLRGEMRTATTDEHAREWFRRYWTLGVGSGAHFLVNAVIDAARERAESPERSPSGSRPRWGSACSCSGW